jgi:hypothetical protein
MKHPLDWSCLGHVTVLSRSRAAADTTSGADLTITDSREARVAAFTAIDR